MNVGKTFAAFNFRAQHVRTPAIRALTEQRVIQFDDEVIRTLNWATFFDDELPDRRKHRLMA